MSSSAFYGEIILLIMSGVFMSLVTLIGMAWWEILSNRLADITPLFYPSRKRLKRDIKLSIVLSFGYFIIKYVWF